MFDTEMQSLAVIEKPADAHITSDQYTFQLLRTRESGLGFAVLSKLTIKKWERKLNCDGVFEWVLLQKTIPLEGMVPTRMDSELFVGYDEDANVTVLTTMTGNFTLQVDSMQLKHMLFPAQGFTGCSKTISRFQLWRRAVATNMLCWL